MFSFITSFLPTFFLPGWLTLDTNPLDGLLQGELLFDSGFYLKCTNDSSLVWKLDFVWLAGLVGACGISVLCSLLRVHLLLEERWEKDLMIHFHFHRCSFSMCGTVKYLLYVFQFIYINLLKKRLIFCNLQLKRKKWQQHIKRELKQSPKEACEWRCWVAPVFLCDRITGYSGVSCGVAGGARILSSSRLWTGYSWTGKTALHDNRSCKLGLNDVCSSVRVSKKQKDFWRNEEGSCQNVILFKHLYLKNKFILHMSHVCIVYLNIY